MQIQYEKSSLHHEVFLIPAYRSSSISEVQGKPNHKQGRAQEVRKGATHFGGQGTRYGIIQIEARSFAMHFL